MTGAFYNCRMEPEWLKYHTICRSVTSLASKFGARLSPLVMASDASESGKGVCRTSTLTPRSCQTSQTWRSHQCRVGLIEISAKVGGLREALQRCGVPKGILVAFGHGAAGKRVIAMAWPDVTFFDNAPKVRDDESATREPQNVIRLARVLRDQCAGSTVAFMLNRGCGRCHWIYRSQTPTDQSVAARRARLAMLLLVQLAHLRRRGVHRTSRPSTRPVPFLSATKHRHKSG